METFLADAQAVAISSSRTEQGQRWQAHLQQSARDRLQQEQLLPLRLSAVEIVPDTVRPNVPLIRWDLLNFKTAPPARSVEAGAAFEVRYLEVAEEQRMAEIAAQEDAKRQAEIAQQELVEAAFRTIDEGVHIPGRTRGVDAPGTATSTSEQTTDENESVHHPATSPTVSAAMAIPAVAVPTNVGSSAASPSVLSSSDSEMIQGARASAPGGGVLDETSLVDLDFGEDTPAHSLLIPASMHASLPQDSTTNQTASSAVSVESSADPAVTPKLRRPTFEHEINNSADRELFNRLVHDIGLRAEPVAMAIVLLGGYKQESHGSGDSDAPTNELLVVDFATLYANLSEPDAGHSVEKSEHYASLAMRIIAEQILRLENVAKAPTHSARQDAMASSLTQYAPRARHYAVAFQGLSLSLEALDANPRELVQALELFDDNCERAQKFLQGSQELKKMGFDDVLKNQEALLMSDLDVQGAIETML